MSSRNIKQSRSKKKLNYNHHVVVVNRSNKNTNIQLLEPITKKTLVTFNSYKQKGTKTEQSTLVGQEMQKYLEKNKITDVIFDRNGYLFHGRIKAVADAIIQK